MKYYFIADAIGCLYRQAAPNRLEYFSNEFCHWNMSAYNDIENLKRSRPDQRFPLTEITKEQADAHILMIQKLP